MIRKRLLFFLSLLGVSPAFGQFSGNALDLDGANDMVTVSSVPSFFGTLGSSSFTFEAWVNPRGLVFSRIFFAQLSTTNFATVSTGGTNNIYFYVVVNGTTYSVATNATLPQNQWTHVAARWTGGANTPQVFFNGVLQAGIAGGTSSTGTSGLMTLGTRPGGAQYFNGAIDEARLWSEARTDCKILSNMNLSITGPQPNLVFDYNFNQGTGGGNNAGITTLPDLSGNSYNGTLVNFTLNGTTSNWITSTATVTTSGNPINGISAVESVTICSGGSVTFPDGTTQSNITAPLTQVSTVTGPSCDTIITTTVNVNPTFTVNDSVQVCSGGAVTFPDGFAQINITAPFSHNSILQTQNGCDSTIVTFVGVLQPTTFAETSAICTGGSYTFPDSTTQTNITSQVVYVSTLQNVMGCDSVVTTTVNVNPVYAQSDSGTVCSGGSYTFPDGSTQTNITAQVVYSSQFSSVSGCDSVITTTVNVNQADTMVTVSGVTLTALASGATFQWLDCGNNFAPLAGDTMQSFTAIVNGMYAVAVTQNGCTDTSGCFNILSTAVSPVTTANEVLVYPNPANDLLFVNAGANTNGIVELVDLAGAVVRRMAYNGSSLQIDLSGLASGMYFVQLHTPAGTIVQKAWKK